MGVTKDQNIAVRRLSVTLLERILGGALLDSALDGPEVARLNTPDRALLRMILTTTLRHLGQIDTLIDLAMEGRAPKPDILHHVLRIGIAELCFMNTPDHAAVSLCVDLADALGLARQKGLVNAVLRRLGREGIADILDDTNLNIPDWMGESWAAHYGADKATEIAAASLRAAPLDITVADPRAIDHWAQTLNGIVLPTGSVRLPNHAGRVEELPGFAEGAWWVQDTSASLPARMLGDVTDKIVLDLCAAPGGKTLQLAAAGARVIAVDASPKRLGRLRDNVARHHLHDRVGVITGDATTLRLPEKVDAILLDAPCSATGTLRRHPDILIHRRASDVARLAAMQRAMLDYTRTLLKPGGTLVYATCSLQPEEGEGQIAAFLDANPDFQTVPITAAEVGLPQILTPQGWARILPTHLPDQGGMDGFFIARLRFQG